MRLTCWTFMLSVLGVVPFSGHCHAGSPPSFPPARSSISILQADVAAQVALPKARLDPSSPEEPMKTVADPLEPVNRVFFHVNDKLYFWVFKPVASGYKAIVPEPVRVSVRNFFSHMATPIRMTNCMLQFDIKGTGTETMRFLLNTTIGVAGFFDPAKKRFNLDRQEEDFGQTLGFYGVGPVFYVDWPILGPSSVRDTVGAVADGFLEPWNYLVTSFYVNAGIKVYDRINRTSLTIGEYEDLKKAALDPYLALRDAYHQYRQKKIEE